MLAVFCVVLVAFGLFGWGGLVFIRRVEMERPTWPALFGLIGGPALLVGVATVVGLNLFLR